jgi:outer membrane protein TolC
MRSTIHLVWMVLLTVFFSLWGPDAAVKASLASSDSRQEHTAEALSLEQAIRLALTRNSGLSARKNALSGSILSLATSRSDFKIQLSPLGSAGLSGGDDREREADYSAGVSVSRQFAPGSRVEFTPRVARAEDGDESYYQSSVGVQLTQPLFRGISPEYNLSSIRGAEYGVRSARRRYFLAQVDVFVQTVSGFYNILLQERLVDTCRQSVERLESFAQAARIKRNIGLATPEDEYRAVQRLKQAKDDLVAKEQALDLATDTLRRLLDWPVSSPIQVDGNLVQETIAVDEADAVETALEKRVEIMEAEDLLRERQRLSRDAEHRLLPELDISFFYTPYGQDASFDDALDLNDSRWGISLSTSSDLFNRAEKAGYRQSLLDIEDARRTLANTRDDIVREVRETIRNLHESASRIELQEERAREAEKQLEISRLKFKYGMTDNFNLIDAESVFSTARTNVENARAQYIVSLYRLRAVMGTLLAFSEEIL